MPLILDTGYISREGRRNFNSDACLATVPDMRSAASHSALFAIADSLDGRNDQGDASRCAVDTLNDSSFAAPREWSADKALRESFAAADTAVAHKGKHDWAAALSALVLSGHHWTLGHLGDTRIWLFREQKLKQLTHDHTLRSLELGDVVTQACGLNETSQLELLSGKLNQGDMFLLTTDGVHDNLDGSGIMSCLLKDRSAQQMAEALVALALEADPTGCASACIVKVERLSNNPRASVAETISALPIGPLPQPGQNFDGFSITSVVHKGRNTVVYKAEDQHTGEVVSLRFPNPRFADDAQFIDSFLREEWINKRHDSPYLIKLLPLGANRRTALYSVLEYHPGESMTQRIRRKGSLSIRETLYLTEQLLECLSYLHSKGITHRDIKPGNILIDKKNKRLLLMGFGLSSIERLQDRGADARAFNGTKTYMAPELLQGHDSDKRADLFSVGVTMYKMLTGKYPYGRVHSVNTETFDEFVPPDSYDPDIPAWLCDVLQRACAADPRQRFSSADEMKKALQPPLDDGDIIKPGHSKAHGEPWQWLLMGGLALLLAGALAWYLGGS